MSKFERRLKWLRRKGLKKIMRLFQDVRKENHIISSTIKGTSRIKLR
jgi:hypothetical protein